MLCVVNGAFEDDGFWYNAYVLDKTGRGASTAVRVHFNGYPKSHRREYTQESNGSLPLTGALVLRFLVVVVILTPGAPGRPARGGVGGGQIIDN